jgi:hypothetical protein
MISHPVQSVSLDDGKGVLKMVYTRVRRGAVQEVVSRNGKVRAVNDDRGVNHSLVRNRL